MDSLYQPNLEIGIWQIISTSFILGTSLHLAIGHSHIEIERHLVLLIGAAIFTCCVGCILLVQRYHYGVLSAIGQASLVYVNFGAGFTSSLAVYRLFFHRCRVFPGPRLASLSRFYSAYMSANINGRQYYEKLEDLHKQYGDFVRTGRSPSHLILRILIERRTSRDKHLQCSGDTTYLWIENRVSKIYLVHLDWLGSRPREPRCDSESCKVPAAKASLGSWSIYEKYNCLSSLIWKVLLISRVFSIYEPRIKAKADLLVNRLQQFAGCAVDSTTWSMLFSFDVMGEISFNQDFNNLASGKEHPGIRVMHSLISLLGILSPVPWLLNTLGNIPGAAQALVDFDTICKNVLAQKEAAWDSTQEPGDVVSWFLKAIKDKDVSATPTRRSLTEDTRGVVIAGSDTTAATLANIFFYLAKHVDAQRKLQQLLEEAMPGGYSTWQYTAVKEVSFIDDIINETLRLKPPVITGVPRETPPHGLQIGKVRVPGNVHVVVPTLPIQRDPRWWKEPNEFIPERWSERKSEMCTDNASWLPFNRGLHHCGGKDVAYLTLRTAVSAIVQNFFISFAPEESEESKSAFDKQFLSAVLMTLRPLHLVFTAREQEKQK